jgi:hypothetical protein
MPDPGFCTSPAHQTLGIILSSTGVGGDPRPEKPNLESRSMPRANEFEDPAACSSVFSLLPFFGDDGWR